jgi:hypothetical protein
MARPQAIERQIGEFLKKRELPRGISVRQLQLNGDSVNYCPVDTATAIEAGVSIVSPELSS